MRAVHKHIGLASVWALMILLSASSCQSDEQPYKYSYTKQDYDPVTDKQSEYIIAIGDIQYGIANPNNRSRLANTFDWIVSQAEHGVKIKGVIQTGDLTDYNLNEEWQRFRDMTMMMQSRIPSIFCIGNHDYQGYFLNQGRNNKYNTYIDYGSTKVDMITCYEGMQENALFRLPLDGGDIYIMTLEYLPRKEVILWADELLNRHNDLPCLLATHRYLLSEGRSNDEPIDPIANNGGQMWHNLIKKHDNIRTVFCGHTIGLIAGQSSTNEYGNTVFELMFNPQYEDHGGVDMIQIWKLSPSTPGLIDIVNYNTRTRTILELGQTITRFNYK